jgi:hypothetical protein
MKSPFPSFRISSLTCFPPELIWNFGFYRKLEGPFRRVISRAARPLFTQNNKKKEETRIEIHVSSENRIHDPSV